MLEGPLLRLVFRGASAVRHGELFAGAQTIARTPVLQMGGESSCVFDLTKVPIGGPFGIRLQSAGGEPTLFGVETVRIRRLMSGSKAGVKVVGSDFAIRDKHIHASIIAGPMAGGLCLRLSDSDDIDAFLNAAHKADTAADEGANVPRFADIVDLLHGLNPYDGFVADPNAVDLQGWGSTDPIFKQLIDGLKPRLIVEVGTWKGRSAIHMAALLRSAGLAATIICIDTWLGSSEHAVNPERRADLKCRHGWPQLYFTFLNNVICEGFSEVIVPFANTSENAAIVMAKYNLKANLIYVDAAHEYDAALRDFGLFAYCLLTTASC